ncbi:MAG: type IV secretory system conjugative DNA transfer family protein [Xanthobacteraceae bacterium]|uniref:type IV secretory system conjugative DNA transfer family protein n=1 Tax=Pseudolabrys sp. TaxID=1960880 RepID=UPI003D0B6B1A
MLFIRILVGVAKLAGWLLLTVVRLARPLVTAGGAQASHGSARWASWISLALSGVWGRRTGIVVGKLRIGFVRYRGDGAVLAFGSMGSGKGTGCVIPALLEYPGAVVCTDPKGENLAVAGRWRSTLGPVFRLDAIHPGMSHRLNPLDLIRKDTHHEADDAAMVADLLVISESREEHWDSSAKQLIAAVIRHVIHTKPTPLQTLAHVRELIAAEAETFASFLREMAESATSSVAEEGRITLASLEAEEMTSVIKNAAKALGFWSKDRIGGMLTATSDFNLFDIHRRPISVFICVPEDKIPVYRPFLRVMMGCALAAAVRGKEFPAPEHKPLLLIDECPALGYLEPLMSGLGYLRAYARTLLVFQDLGQLKRIYGEHGARSFIAASGCQVAFSVNDNDTARELAESVGMTTVLSRSESSSQGVDPMRHHSQSGRSETGRFLLDASEIRRLPQSRCLIFMSGLLPILARKVRHYRVRAWRGRWDAWRDSDRAVPTAPEVTAMGDVD